MIKNKNENKEIKDVNKLFVLSENNVKVISKKEESDEEFFERAVMLAQKILANKDK